MNQLLNDLIHQTGLNSSQFAAAIGITKQELQKKKGFKFANVEWLIDKMKFFGVTKIKSDNVTIEVTLSK